MNATLLWFRRDLRLHDNAALAQSLADADRVYACFCFDREFLDRPDDRADRRVEFMHQSVAALDSAMRHRGARLIVRHGPARDVIPALAAELGVSAVYANDDYEPKLHSRDAAVARRLQRDGRTFRTLKDHVIFDPDEILNRAGRPFRVFTPYRNAWRARLTVDDYRPRRCGRGLAKLSGPPRGVRSNRWRLNDLGFLPTDLRQPGGAAAGRRTLAAFVRRIDEYARRREFPALDGTSRLSVHLRFGTVSVREALARAMRRGSDGAQRWIDQIIWRDFYNAALHHFPDTEAQPFQSRFRRLRWRRDRRTFRRWCAGDTGYPIVDAGMRQLNATGFMHNRLRMITASFLTKHLRIDWAWGERYFARKLLDFDLSQNVGGWQWAAGIGTDAQPYFRIFNPVAQSRRYDPNGDFIRAYVAELRGLSSQWIHTPWLTPHEEQIRCRCVVGRDYPVPLVDHREARRAALAMFRVASR